MRGASDGCAVDRSGKTFCGKISPLGKAAVPESGASAVGGEGGVFGVTVVDPNQPDAAPGSFGDVNGTGALISGLAIAGARADVDPGRMAADLPETAFISEERAINVASSAAIC